MEKMKRMKIIAVDTSIGTNFLLSACEDATMSELRGLIQKEHISCFPEHESIKVGALMVEYSQKQYHVTDPLLVGQVFRKCWNKIHAEVSSGFVRAASTSNGPKRIERESFANGETGTVGATLVDQELAKHPEALQNAQKKKSGADDRQPLIDEDPAHGSSALLCWEKILNNCNGTDPARMANQIDQEEFRCPLLSSEAPYTQPCSQLNEVTRAVLSKGAQDIKRKYKRRRCVEEDEILVRKQNQVDVDCQFFSKSDRDKESIRYDVNSSSTKEEPRTDKHKEARESFQQYEQDTGREDGFSEKAALTNRDEHLSNAYDKPNNDYLQQDTGNLNDSLSLDNCMAIVREHNENSLPTNTEAFVSSPGEMKLPLMVFESHHTSLKRAPEAPRSCRAQGRVLDSSLNERGDANLESKTEDPVNQTSDRIGTKGCPEISVRNQEEEANLNDGAPIYQMDLSRGYPIQLNDHSILLVASLSSDVVPETQESQMEPQDSIKPGGEEAVAHAKGGLEAPERSAVERPYGCFRHERHPQLVDPVEPQEKEAPGLPFCQDARNMNMNTKEANNRMEDLEMLLDKVEYSKMKPLDVGDQPSKSLSREENAVISEGGKLRARHCDRAEQLLDVSFPGGIDDSSLHRKKKKRRKRKVSEIQTVVRQEDGSFVDLDSKQQDVPGGVDPEKTMVENAQGGDDPKKRMVENAQLKESLIETTNGNHGTCNQDKVNESSHKLENQAKIVMGSSDNDSVRSKDLGSYRSEMKERKVSKRVRSKSRKRQKHSVLGGAIRPSEKGKCDEAASFSGQNIAEPKKVSIESSFRAEIGEECMEGSSIGGHNSIGQENLCAKEGGEGHNPIGQENLCVKEGGRKDFDMTRRKRMKQRKEPTTPVRECHDDAVINNTSSNCESASVDRFVDKYNEDEVRSPSIKESKELLNALRLAAAFEEDEQRQDNMILNANARGEQAMQKKSKREKKTNKDADVNICVTQEKDDNRATVHVDDTESLLKDGLVMSSSTYSSSKEGLVTTNNQGFDVFEFEGSETVNRQKENTIHAAATSNSEADNLDKLCSVAVKFVEGETTTTRKTGRKAVHPKRWITVLSERLTWNQASKSSKRKRVNKKSRLSTKGTCPVEMPSDDDFNTEVCHMEEEEANDGSSQVIADDGGIACPVGCGRLYTKKTSAYYRHRRRCPG
eukprot:c24852_g1_i1 orf=193-3738(+)